MGLLIAVEQDRGLSDKISALVFKRPQMRFIDVGKVDEVKEVMQVEMAHVVLLGPSVLVDDAIDLARQLMPSYPALSIVLIAGDLSAEQLRETLRAGIRDVVFSADPQDNVSSAIVAAYDSAEQHLRQHSEFVGYADSQGLLAEVTTIFGTKGGVGKSTVASNVAVALAQEYKMRTILLDLDLQFGDIAIMLQLPPEQTMYDAVQDFSDLDAEMLKGFLVKHESGVEALLAPIQPEEAESIGVEQVTRIISLLRQLADFVVIDTPASFSDIVLAALDSSDQIYPVATMDVPSIKNTRISVQKLEQLGLTDRTMGLVLNRAGTKVGLETTDVCKAVGCNVIASVPSDRLVPRAVNRGVPVVTDVPRSAVSRSLVKLACEIAGAREEARTHVA